MMQKSNKDLVGWTACLISFLFLFLNGSASANKEGYYGKYIGKLSQLNHGVSGDVFAVDARTLHIRNFNYDGEGPAAYFYAGTSKAPGVNGFRLRDERGTTNVLPRYRNKHITITFPEGKNLQNVRWFSVWCDEFSVNFGDVKIPKNLDFPKPQKISGLSGVHGVSSEPIVVVDAQTLLIPSFSYDGEAPDAKFWVGRGLKPSPQGIRIPDENGKELPLRRYDRKTIVLTLPGDLTIFDIGHFGIWCEAFTVDFGHVQIPQGLNIPPSLKMLGVSPQSKLNCEVLWDDFAYEVRWAVAGDSIVLQLVARLENNEYMSFGLSGDRSRSQMVGGDVVVAWVDKESLKGYAQDYFLDAKSQCSGGRGSCPDENIEADADSVRLLNAALVNGYSIVTFQRSLKAQDYLDKDVFTNASQPIIWAIGPLNSRREVSYHSLANRGDIFVNFGRPPKWNCPTPESVSDQIESENPMLNREFEDVRIQSAKIQESSRRESRPKNYLPTPATALKSTAWEIPSIKCYEPEDGVFYAQMGPTGGKHGYSAITGHVGWGISWYINGLLIPEINVVRGRTYTFIVEGGLDPEIPARYHPFYITDDPIGGYQYKTPQERANIQIFAGAVQNKRGEVRPTGIGRLCNWTPDPSAPPADEFTSFGAYQRTLRLECDPGNPGIIQWTVEKDTPDTVYYQCYTHRYLGWKINVHDYCEGEAASDPEPSIIKTPASLIKSQEGDPEGAESIRFETRTKPSAEILKSILEKGRTNFGVNELVNYSKNHSNFSQEQLKGLQNDFEVKTSVVKHQAFRQIPSHHFQYPKTDILLEKQFLKILQPSSVQENGFIKSSAESLPPKYLGYSVTEEYLEGSNEQNFQIVPVASPQHSQILSELQNGQHSQVMEPNRVTEPLKSENNFQEEYSKNLDVLRTRTEEKLYQNNRKLPYNKSTTKLPGDLSRSRKPLLSNSLALQKRPFPVEAVRPSILHQKLQKRPTILSSHKSVQTKSPHFHQRVTVAFHPNDFNKQEIHFIQFKRPNKMRQNPSLGTYDLFGSSTVDKIWSKNSTFTENRGFDPQSVHVEGGFKPILSAGITPKLSSTSVDRGDLEIMEDENDKVGAIELISSKGFIEKEILLKKAQESFNDEKSTKKKEENKDKQIDLFKNQKPQTFEPIFKPSYPDESAKKQFEKFRKKPLLSLKLLHDQFQGYNLINNSQVFQKTRPLADMIRIRDNADPSFQVRQEGETPQIHLQEFENFGEKQLEPKTRQRSSNNFLGNSKAENILELLQMYEKESDKSEANGPATSKDFFLDAKFKTEKIAQDEIAMADAKKEFYLPPKPDEFLSYDGKVVRAIKAPTLPETITSADITKLPQFVLFKGVTPPLSLKINDKNLPQLRTSKLARYDILPPSNFDVEGTILKVSTLRKIEKIQERKKRSADHTPGHKEHDRHYQHYHHNAHNGGSCSAANSLKIALISFTLISLRKHIGF